MLPPKELQPEIEQRVWDCMDIIVISVWEGARNEGLKEKV